MRNLRLATLFGLLLASRAWTGEFKTLSETWTDEKRHRDVPVKIYYPADLSEDKPAPVVIFSHGLGGSRDGYAMWGETFAGAGYISVHLQHIGSDESLWRGKLGDPGSLKDKLKEGMSAEAYMDRIGDVKFALDKLTEINSADGKHALKGKLDLKHVAMAGHSFGAQTTQAMAGQIATFGKRELSGYDDRITCAIAMSPAPPKGPPAVTGQAFSKIRMPVLWMTGTKDESALREAPPETRRVPFDKTTAKDQYLIIFKDADHMAFSVRGPMGTKLEKELKGSALAFLDAYLRVDAEKQKSLADDLKKVVKSTGTVESK